MLQGETLSPNSEFRQHNLLGNLEENLWPMVIATRYRNRRSVARAGLLLLGLRQQGESFEVFKKKEIRLIVFVSNTTNIRCFIHISNEDGDGWTTIALDRATREWSIAQRRRQLDAAMAACEQLYI